ncbi:MAG: hypothetical protein L0Z62_02955 [Gemmataceae bacterium]|nr:hypothetical protein [Gemmataceae bacterium]
MPSLSEQILECVALASDGQLTNQQIAAELGVSGEWVEQILIAWQSNPRVVRQPPPAPPLRFAAESLAPSDSFDALSRPQFCYAYEAITRIGMVELDTFPVNMVYDTGRRAPDGSRLPDGEPDVPDSITPDGPSATE